MNFVLVKVLILKSVYVRMLSFTNVLHITVQIRRQWLRLRSFK
jgi:hypothetical protein